MYFCLLSNASMLAIKCIFIQKADCISRNTSYAICFLFYILQSLFFKLAQLKILYNRCLFREFYL